jgi:hypothetical protein
MLAEPSAVLGRVILASLGKPGACSCELGIAHLAVVVRVDPIEADSLTRFAVGLVELAVMVSVEPVEYLVGALFGRSAGHFTLRRRRLLGIGTTAEGDRGRAGDQGEGQFTQFQYSIWG